MMFRFDPGKFSSDCYSVIPKSGGPPPAGSYANRCRKPAEVVDIEYFDVALGLQDVLPRAAFLCPDHAPAGAMDLPVVEHAEFWPSAAVAASRRREAERKLRRVADALATR